MRRCTMGKSEEFRNNFEFLDRYAKAWDGYEQDIDFLRMVRAVYVDTVAMLKDASDTIDDLEEELEDRDREIDELEALVRAERNKNNGV